MGLRETVIKCPIHRISDCSPLLNGCSLPIKLQRYEIYREALERIAYDSNTLSSGAALIAEEALKE